MLNGCLWPRGGPLDVAHAQSVAHVQTAQKHFLIGFNCEGSQTEEI